MSIDITLAAESVQDPYAGFEDEDDDQNNFNQDGRFFSPGDVITKDAGFMRGHGTYMKNGTLYASVAGVIQRVNKLISVTPLKTKYQGEIGDVIVGKELFNSFLLHYLAKIDLEVKKSL